MRKVKTGNRIKLWLMAVAASALLAGTAFAGEMNPSGFEDDDYPGEHVETDIEGGISQLIWSGDYAVWYKYGDVSKYRITLYRDQEKIVSKYVVSQTRLDLGKYIIGSGDFRFTVEAETGWGWTKPYVSLVRSHMDELYSQQRAREQAIEAAENKKKNNSSSSGKKTAVSAAEGEKQAAEAAAEAASSGEANESAVTVGWIQTEDGTGRWWYQNADGTYPVSDWKTIDKNQYYFDEEGWMVTGEYEIEGITYVFDENGAWTKESFKQ